MTTTSELCTGSNLQLKYVAAQAQAMRLPAEADGYGYVQAPDIRIFAEAQRDSLLQSDSGRVGTTRRIAAMFVESAIVSTEQQIYATTGEVNREALSHAYELREAGFSTAGVMQTGLRPPRSYQRIAAIAAGYAANINKNR